MCATDAAEDWRVPASHKIQVKQGHEQTSLHQRDCVYVKTEIIEKKNTTSRPHSDHQSKHHHNRERSEHTESGEWWLKKYRDSGLTVYQVQRQLRSILRLNVDQARERP